MMHSPFPKFESSALLVHIAFHFVRERVPYLEQVVNTILKYNFSKVDIVIDTNSFESSEVFPYPEEKSNVSVSFKVHEQLPHPCLLTWQHRWNMKEHLDDYDYFMYLEDDIMVPYEALERWRKDSQFLFPRGYARGFLRVERNKQGVMVCTDQYKPAKAKNLVWIQDSLYYSPHIPYQAFWVYSREQMLQFIKSPAWENDGSTDHVRERAASGNTYLDRKKIKREKIKHNILIPIVPSNTVPHDVLVYHLPNTYADDPESHCGSMPVEHLLKPESLSQVVQKFLKW